MQLFFLNIPLLLPYQSHSYVILVISINRVYTSQPKIQLSDPYILCLAKTMNTKYGAVAVILITFSQ